jgi:hypothetical protein
MTVHTSMPTSHQSPECPCGRARAGCEYHDPALQPAVPDTVKAADKTLAGFAVSPLRQMCIGGTAFYTDSWTVRSIGLGTGTHELTFDLPAYSPALTLVQAMYNADLSAVGPVFVAVLLPGVMATNSAWWTGVRRINDTVTFTMRWIGPGPQVTP